MKNVGVSTLIIAAFLFTIGCGGGTSQSGEHPKGEHTHKKGEKHEHPEGEDHEHPEGKEHPEGEEHPESKEHPQSSSNQKMSIEKFADAAEQYIKKETKKNGGHFLVEDKKRDSTLKLQLTKVHRKRLSHLGNNVYFVCANFKSTDGTIYDIDIFMKGTSPNNLKATRAPKVHKVAGKARFTWYKDKKEGVWKTRSVST